MWANGTHVAHSMVCLFVFVLMSPAKTADHKLVWVMDLRGSREPDHPWIRALLMTVSDPLKSIVNTGFWDWVKR